MLIDDSSTPKAGKSSAGVARQYCGKLGKVENCQSGVFAILSKGNKYSMIDGQLYLPKEWIEDEVTPSRQTKIESKRETIYT